MSYWPVALPQSPLSSSYGEDWQDGAIRSQMDTGPAKVRRRFTALVKTYSVAFVLTDRQVEILMEFWEETCTMGTLTFTWQDPRTQDPATVRFASRPGISHDNGMFRVQFQIEVLP